MTLFSSPVKVKLTGCGRVDREHRDRGNHQIHDTARVVRAADGHLLGLQTITRNISINI